MAAFWSCPVASTAPTPAPVAAAWTMGLAISRPTTGSAIAASPIAATPRPSRRPAQPCPRCYPPCPPIRRDRLQPETRRVRPRGWWRSRRSRGARWRRRRSCRRSRAWRRWRRGAPCRRRPAPPSSTRAARHRRRASIPPTSERPAPRISSTGLARQAQRPPALRVRYTALRVYFSQGPLISGAPAS